MTKKRKNEAGFTLVEMLVVMVIIGLLATFVVINVLPAQDKAMVQKTRADIALLESALDQYKLDMFDYPSEDVGLEALTELPNGAPNAERYRKGGYIKQVRNDPWGRPYIYRYPGDQGVYDLISYGADGQPGGEDLAADITNWDK